MVDVEIENKRMFMLKRLCDMNDAEILKMSSELSHVPLYFHTASDYLNLFITLRIFLKNVDIANGITEIRGLCNELDKQLIKSFPEIFSFLNVIVANIYYFDRSIFSDGFSAFLDRKSTSAYDGTPHTPIEKVNRLTYMINHFPYAFYKEARRYNGEE